MPPELDRKDDEKQMLAHVPEDGRAIGNSSLRKLLKWDITKYSDIRNSLINKELLQLGRGRGGSVSRVVASSDQGETTLPVSKIKEKSLYPKFHKALSGWAKLQGWTDHFIEHKPSQGKKNTGGMWTRPDFVVVGYNKYEYTPGPVRDIETFEIKTSSFSIDAVFETASHSRFSTKSHLAVLKSEELVSNNQLLSRVEFECVRFGIGLLLFTDSDDPDSWEWPVEAVRKEPDAQEVEEYIRQQFDDENKKKMRTWF